MYRAIMDRVIVQLSADKSSSAILNTEEKHRNRGVVLSVGESVHGVKVGDEIIFHRFDELPLAQKDIVVVREKSILGTVNKSN